MKIAIAGAGLMGRLLAFQLLQLDNHEITLYDCDTQIGLKSCSMAAAGMLAPYCELEKSNTKIMQVGKESLQLWPSILNALNASIYFKQHGSLVTANYKDHDELMHYLDKISQQCSNPPFQAVLPNLIEPEITEINPWYYFPDEAQIDTQQVLRKLGDYLKSKVQWQENQKVINVKPYEVHLKNAVHRYDWVFDCRGLGALTLFPHLHGIRGELIWVYARNVNLSRPIRLIHPHYRIYIVPRENHHYIIGSTEIESEDYSEISVRSTLELLTAAYSIHKGFIEARIIRTVTHCRPTLPNHEPKIKYSLGLVAINGLYRHGYLLAPQLIQDVIFYLYKGIQHVRYPIWWEKYD